MKTFLKKISSSRVGFMLKRGVAEFEFVIMGYYHDPETVALLKRIAREDSPFLLNPSELYNIYAFAGLQRNVDGDFAEVGVYKGATAKAICEQKSPERNLHLFDTFAGLPDVDEVDREMFDDAMYDASLEHVERKLAPYTNVQLHKGLFPAETSHAVEDARFAFVHLDVDLYRSTKEALAFFYPRLATGGVLISHDYHASGVRQAFDEFTAEHPGETIDLLQLATSQCVLFKRG